MESSNENSESKILTYAQRPVTLRPNNFQINREMIRRTSRDSIVSVSKYGHLCKRPTVTVTDNIFQNNLGLAMVLDHSISRCKLRIEHNLFEFNLSSITCNIESNSEATLILKNIFKIFDGKKEQMIRIAKKFKNLEFLDNEFMEAEGREGSPEYLLKLLYKEAFEIADNEDSMPQKHKATLRGPMTRFNKFLMF